MCNGEQRDEAAELRQVLKQIHDAAHRQGDFVTDEDRLYDIVAILRYHGIDEDGGKQ